MQMPKMTARRQIFARHLVEQDIDIWLLQELWEACDYHRLQATAQASGYRLFTALGESRSAHGLAILVRSDIISEQTAVDITGAFYPYQYPLEYWPGPSIRRAWIAVSFIHRAWQRRITVFNTHLGLRPPELMDILGSKSSGRLVEENPP